MAKLEGKVVSLEGKLRGMGREGQKAGDKTAKAGKVASGSFDLDRVRRFSTALLGIGSVAAGVALAWRLVQAEIKTTINLQKQAGQKQVTLNSARLDVARNMAGASEAEVAKVLAAGGSIATDEKIEERYIQAAIASAISASGGNVPSALAAVRQSAKFLPDKPAEIAGFAGSLLDLAKVTGTDDAKVNQGLLSMVGAMSRVVNPRQQAMNIPRSLIGQMAFGAEAPTAAALFAALTTGSGDFMGATTGTASIALAEQLEAFLPAAGKTAQSKGGLGELDRIELADLAPRAQRARDRAAAGKTLGTKARADWRRHDALKVKEASLTMEAAIPAGMGTLGDRIGYLQANPEMAGQFLKSASFEKVAKGPIIQLLTEATSDVAKQFATNLKQIPTVQPGAVWANLLPGLGKQLGIPTAPQMDRQAMAALADQSIANFAADPLSANAEMQRGFTSAEEKLLTMDSGMGAAGIAREGGRKALLASGQSALATKIGTMWAEWESGVGTRDPIGAQIELLEGRIGELRAPRAVRNQSYVAAGAFGAAASPDYLPATEDALMRADMLDTLRQMLEELKSANRNSAAPTTLGHPDEDR